MKVAIVHEWFTSIGGSEKVVQALAELFPKADLFGLVKDDEILSELGFSDRNFKSSIIQKLPFSRRHYRLYLPFFPFAVEQLDLSSYDLIISSNHVVAKGVLTRFDQLHICYCHSPIRYAWDLYHQYLSQSGLGFALRGIIARWSLHRLRQWDVISASRVNHFISNSDFTGQRINKIYNRKAQTIYPPVDTDGLGISDYKEDFYFTCSRLVPYKRIDVIIKAFNEMPDRKLIVGGTGPDEKKLKRIAGANIHFTGHLTFEKKKELFQKAKAFVYAAIEDFGITMVEAQACGTPVIALSIGGAREIIVNGETGLFFRKQTPEDLVDAVENFDNLTFDSQIIRNNALRFSKIRFQDECKSYIEERIREWRDEKVAI